MPHNVLLRIGFPVCRRFLGAEGHQSILWRLQCCRILEGARAATTSSYSSQPQRFPELRFSAALGKEPEVELTLV